MAYPMRTRMRRATTNVRRRMVAYRPNPQEPRELGKVPLPPRQGPHPLPGQTPPILPGQTVPSPSDPNTNQFGYAPIKYGAKGLKTGIAKIGQARNQPGFIPRGQRDGVPNGSPGGLPDDPNTPVDESQLPLPGGGAGTAGTPGMPGVGDVFSQFSAGQSSIANLQRAIAQSQAAGVNATTIPQWQSQLDALMASQGDLQGQYDTALSNIGKYGNYQKGGMLGKFNERWQGLNPNQRRRRAEKAGFDTPWGYAQNERSGLQTVIDIKNAEWNPLDVATFGNTSLITDPERLAKLQNFINAVGVKNAKGWFDAKDAQDVLLAYQLGMPFADKLAAEFAAIQASEQAIPGAGQGEHGGTVTPEATSGGTTTRSDRHIDPVAQNATMGYQTPQAALAGGQDPAKNIAYWQSQGWNYNPATTQWSATGPGGMTGRRETGGAGPAAPVVSPSTSQVSPQAASIQTAIAQLPLDPQFESVRRVLEANLQQQLAFDNAQMGNIQAQGNLAEARLQTNEGVDTQRLMESLAARGAVQSSENARQHGLLATDYGRQGQDLAASIASSLSGVSQDQAQAYNTYYSGLEEALLASAQNAAADQNAPVAVGGNRNRRHRKNRRNRRRRHG